MPREHVPVIIFLSVFPPIMVGGCTEHVSSETEPRIAEAPVLSLMDEFSQASVDMSIKGEHRPVLLMAWLQGDPANVNDVSVRIETRCERFCQKRRHASSENSYFGTTEYV